MTNAGVGVDADFCRNLNFTQSHITVSKTPQEFLLIQIKSEEKQQEGQVEGGRDECLFSHQGEWMIEVQKDYRL